MVKRVEPSIKTRENIRLAVLKEQDGHRYLEMSIDILSHEYLAAALEKRVLPVASSHKALEACMHCLQANIEQVVVYALTEGYFRARMTIRDQRENRTYAVEVNVIDGIVSAVITGCPILVVEDVFRQNDEETERVGRDYFTAQAQLTFNNIKAGNGKKM